MQAFENSLSATGGGKFSAYVARPKTPAGPVLIALQEIVGVNKFIRGIANEYTARGYLASAPDLFWRQAPDIQSDPGNTENFARAIASIQKAEE